MELFSIAHYGTGVLLRELSGVKMISVWERKPPSPVVWKNLLGENIFR